MHENNPFARNQASYDDEQDFDTSVSSSSGKDVPWEDWDEQVAADGSIRGQTILSMDEMFNFFSDLASEKIANDVGIEANFGAGEYEKKRKGRKSSKSVTASGFEQEDDAEDLASASWGTSSRSNARASSSLGFNSDSSSSRVSSRSADSWNETELDASGLVSWDNDSAGDAQANSPAAWERGDDSQDSLPSWSSESSHTFGSAAQPQASANDDFLARQLQAYQGNSDVSATQTVHDEGEVETSGSLQRVRGRSEVVGAASRRQGADTDAEDSEVLTTGATLSGGAVERFAWEQLRLLPAGNPQISEFLSQAYLSKLPFLGVSEEVIAQQLLELEQAQTSLTLPALMQGEYHLDMAGLVNYLQEHLSVNALAYWSLSELERELVLQIVDYHDPQQYDRDNRMINYLYFVNLRLLDLLRDIHTAEQRTN